METPNIDVEQDGVEVQVPAVTVQDNSNNSIGGRTWNLVSADPDNPVKEGWVKISQISFEGYATADDRCVVEDGRGNVIFETFGNLELQPVMTALGEYIWVYNLTLAELTSGKCLVHIL